MGLGETPAWSEWPDVLQRVAEACGPGVALSLAGAYGGREIYIPSPDAIGENHHLAISLGLASAREAAKALGAGKIIIPLGPVSSAKRRAEAIRRMRREGKTNPATARALGIHVRTVEVRHQRDRERGLAGHQSDTLNLFED